jgi:hypothetical protein
MDSKLDRDNDFWQADFDMTIGRLDRVLSKMVDWGRLVKSQSGVIDPVIDIANQQTLKHHAEDMIAAGNKILKDLGQL